MPTLTPVTVPGDVTLATAGFAGFHVALPRTAPGAAWPLLSRPVSPSRILPPGFSLTAPGSTASEVSWMVCGLGVPGAAAAAWSASKSFTRSISRALVTPRPGTVAW